MISRKDGTMNRVRQAAAAALEETGREAVDCVRACMQQGYGKPIYQSGALMADVQAALVDETTLAIGNTLPYAQAVHRHRPYLREGLEGAVPTLQRVMAEGIRREMERK